MVFLNLTREQEGESLKQKSHVNYTSGRRHHGYCPSVPLSTGVILWYLRDSNRDIICWKNKRHAIPVSATLLLQLCKDLEQEDKKWWSTMVTTHKSINEPTWYVETAVILIYLPEKIGLAWPHYRYHGVYMISLHPTRHSWQLPPQALSYPISIC